MPLRIPPRASLPLAALLAVTGGWLTVPQDDVPDVTAQEQHHHGSPAAEEDHHGGMPMVPVPAAAFEAVVRPVAAARQRSEHRSTVLRLGRPQVVSGLRYDPTAGSSGVVRYAVEVQRGRGAWTEVTRGRWAPDDTERAATFSPVRARAVRLRSLSSAAAGASDDVRLVAAKQPAPAAAPTVVTGRRDGTLGRWGDPIGLPLVPTTAVLLPRGKVLTMSAYTPDDYDYETDLTQISIFDTRGGTPGRREVSETGHQMFCTGVSVLADGRVLITGGSSPSNTTIYDPRSDSFSTGPQMEVPRGYQTSVTLSDGRVFTLGGSWSGGRGDKDGEVLDADATRWSRLPAIKATSILTDDEAGIFRSDNHAWLFADRGGSVFHAGPSRAMHWFDTSGDGATESAGRRADAPDQMNGNAVMYARGKVLAVGGAPSYSDSPATARAWTIDFRKGPGHDPVVADAGRMSEPRAMHNSVVLPTGDVLVTGGQERALPFSDADSALTATLWSPRTRSFRDLAAQAVPRNYHSWSLLLADGRVLTGGGGLCGECEFNHPDVEIFTPPYLLRPDGSRRSRPVIRAGVPRAVDPGDRLVVRASRRTESWALVRTGSATHSINSDQRRVQVRSRRGSDGRFRLVVPGSGAAVPGTYLLFAMDANGTPSKGRWLRVR